MDISEMSTEQKSIMLAKVAGWHVVKSVDDGIAIRCLSDGRDQFGYALPERHCHEASDKWVFENCLPDLYNSSNMALAWRVLNWVADHHGIAADFDDWWFGQRKYLLFAQKPEVAQRLCLDKVLEIAVEAGLVDTAVTEAQP